MYVTYTYLPYDCANLGAIMIIALTELPFFLMTAPQ